MNFNKCVTFEHKKPTILTGDEDAIITNENVSIEYLHNIKIHFGCKWKKNKIFIHNENIIRISLQWENGFLICCCCCRCKQSLITGTKTTT